MTTGFESYTPVAVPSQRVPADDFGGGEAPPNRIGHPRPARRSSSYLVSEATDQAYPVVAESGSGGGFASAGAAAATQVGSPRRGRSGALALLLVLALGGIVGWQAYQIDRLGDRLVDADRGLGEALVADRSRVGGLEGRATALEQTAGQAFNPEAISAAVLPSVFRVRAGNFTGTAFAVGAKAGTDKTNLLTNYHVVASVWETDGSKVSLERGGVEVPARIVKVNKDRDLAQLVVEKKITGLVPNTTSVKSGQQIMVVGAPLGLEDTVTTGVVSAFRKDKAAGTTMIQFDAPINPGNSGGPVINASKQVVGLATAKARDAEGIGLAIPVKTACETFDVC
jgi:putative serine protease PepD